MSSFSVIVCKKADAADVSGRIAASGLQIGFAPMGRRTLWREKHFARTPTFAHRFGSLCCIDTESFDTCLAPLVGFLDDPQVRKRMAAFETGGWSAAEMEAWKEKQSRKSRRTAERDKRASFERLVFELVHEWPLAFGWYWLDATLNEWEGFATERRIPAPLHDYEEGVLHLPDPARW